MRIGTYERIAQCLLVGQPKPKIACNLYKGIFYIGSKSLDRTKQSCKWRTFWRIKRFHSKTGV